MLHKKCKENLLDLFKNLNPEQTVELWKKCILEKKYTDRVPFLYDELDDVYGVIAKNLSRDDHNTFHALDTFWYFLSKNGDIPADYRNGLTFGYFMGFESALSMKKYWEDHPEEYKRLKESSEEIKNLMKEVGFDYQDKPGV